MLATALPTDRLFIALDLPDGARDALSRDAASLGDTPGLRAVPRANLHVTVRFVGRIPAVRCTATFATELFDAMNGPVHRIRLGRTVARPSSRRARLVVTEVLDEDGALAAHAARIDAVVDRFVDDRRTRPFWPHVTVARFRRPTPVRRYPQQEHEHVFDIDRISLYHSEITGVGPPIYRPLMTVPLGESRERNASDG